MTVLSLIGLWLKDYTGRLVGGFGLRGLRFESLLLLGWLF